MQGGGVALGGHGRSCDHRLDPASRLTPPHLRKMCPPTHRRAARLLVFAALIMIPAICPGFALCCPERASRTLSGSIPAGPGETSFPPQWWGGGVCHGGGRSDDQARSSPGKGKRVKGHQPCSPQMPVTRDLPSGGGVGAPFSGRPGIVRGLLLGMTGCNLVSGRRSAVPGVSKRPGRHSAGLALRGRRPVPLRAQSAVRAAAAIRLTPERNSCMPARRFMLSACSRPSFSMYGAGS